jgi:hypothetical protein
MGTKNRTPYLKAAQAAYRNVARRYPDELKAERERLLAEQRGSQGLPEHVEDPATLDRLARLLREASELIGRPA